MSKIYTSAGQSQSMDKPLLSICIPTFNRAAWLETALYWLAPQVKAFSPYVELVVSDNCSSDNTAEIVERAQAWGPIRYYRNQQNQGATGNILRLTYSLARGEFAWIVGDDDVVRPDGVARVLDILRNDPEIDFILINISPKTEPERPAVGSTCSQDRLPLLPTTGRIIDRAVTKWEELLDPDINTALFTGHLMCGVFRLARWCTYKLEPGPLEPPFSNLEWTYPHAVILAHTMVGRKAYYLGYPAVMIFYGGQEWLNYSSIVLLVRAQELLDLYRRLGVPWKQVEKCRSYILGISGYALNTVLFGRDVAGRQYFSLRRFLWQNRHHPGELCRILIAACRAHVRTWTIGSMPTLLKRALRSIVRAIYRIPRAVRDYNID